jgi:anti-anti-sigma factor
VFSASAVQVDLTDTTFIDSTAIGVLVSACKRVRASNGAFSVRCSKGGVQSVLKLAGLAELLQLEDTA